jgi:hypothetical protein
METEAELGSDNEDNDDRKKIINKDDDDEVEGAELDEDLIELINNAREEGNEEAMMSKFLRDMKEEDQKAFKQAY